jgi:hypothetical protein
LLSTKGQHRLSQQARDHWLQTSGTSETLKLRLTVRDVKFSSSGLASITALWQVHEGHELLGDRDGKVFVSVSFGPAGANREQQ